MKMLLVIIALAIIALVVYALVQMVAKGVQKASAARTRRRQRDGIWTTDEFVHKGKTWMLVKHPDPELDDIRIGPISCDLPSWEYDEQLIDLRLEAEAKADSLNRRLNA